MSIMFDEDGKEHLAENPVDNATRLEKERCLAAVEQEEEFDGEMPDELWDKICDAVYGKDKDRVELMFRMALVLAKGKIKARIEAGG